MSLTDKWEKRGFLKISDLLYSSLVKRFEILSGKEFASKVISSSAYSAVKNFLNGEKINDGLEGFLKDVIAMTVGGKVCKYDVSRESGGVVQVKGCLEAEMHGPANEGVCYLTAGIIKAVAEKMVGGAADVKERKCMSMGSDFCEFAVVVSAGEKMANAFKS